MSSWLPCFFVLAVSACSTGGESKLEERLSQVRGQQSENVAPIPRFSSQPIYTYSSRFKRSPFIAESEFKANVTAEQSQALPPDLDRKKQPLELKEVSLISMVGLVRNKSNLWGLVADQTGKLSKVELGGYLGMNFGEVTAIDSSKITIIEKISDNRGRWFARSRLIFMEEVD
jgi:type IV pilus assembly protein PilP